MVELNYASYCRKLKGCFMGKTVGGTLGMPLEGFIGMREVTYYDPVPTEMIANDDLDLQVVWLEVIRRRGLPVNRYDLAEGWLEHVSALPDEYGVAGKNLRVGLYPPLSGYYDNKIFYAGMGAAIRTEIWAALAPGDPALAVMLAREDASVDHHDDGVEASAFLAAVESAAYLESDRDRLIEIGLSFINPSGRLHRMLTDTMAWWKETEDTAEVRERILGQYYRQNWTDVGINLSFILLSWFAGRGDVSRSLCTAAGLGHDADCTTATLGAILGLLNPDGFEKRWIEPLGDKLVLSSCIGNMHETSTIPELCDQISALCAEALSYYDSEVRLIGAPDGERDYERPWAAPGRFPALSARYNKRESLIAVRPLMVGLTYPDRVALAPGETASFTARIAHPRHVEVQGQLELRAPDGWTVSPAVFALQIPAGGETEVTFSVTASRADRRVGKNQLDLNFHIGDSLVSVSAGLIRTFDFLQKPMPYEADDCPPLALFEDAEIVSEPGYYRRLPDGGMLLMAELRPSDYHAEAVLIAQGTQPVKVWLDGKLVLQHDGCEYVPAFHRSDYIARLKELTMDWHTLIIQTGGRRDRDTPTCTPNNALVPVPGSLPLLTQRQLYDSENLYGGEEGELFFSIASRTGIRWITDMEWRIPEMGKTNP